MSEPYRAWLPHEIERWTTPRQVITEVKCDECDGTGNDDYGDTCGWCRGVGTAEQSVVLDEASPS